MVQTFVNFGFGGTLPKWKPKYFMKVGAAFALKSQSLKETGFSTIYGLKDNA